MSISLDISMSISISISNEDCSSDIDKASIEFNYGSSVNLAKFLIMPIFACQVFSHFIVEFRLLQYLHINIGNEETL